MKLIANEDQICVSPALIMAAGMNGAIFLHQLHMHLEQQSDLIDENDDDYEEAWYCQSYENWAKQLPFWNVPQIMRTVQKLEQLRIIHTTLKFNKYHMDRTKWYRIDYERLHFLMMVVENELMING